MNAALVAAGCIYVVAAAIHGGAGEALVMRRLTAETLPSTPFGGARMTRAMVHVTWHLTTMAFLTVGVALLLSGAVLEGDAARGIAYVAAVASTGFGAIALGLGIANTRSPGSLLRHPGPIVLTAGAVLAWLGTL
jgi:hypothetical protein